MYAVEMGSYVSGIDKKLSNKANKNPLKQVLVDLSVLYLKEYDEEQLNREQFPEEEVMFTISVSIRPISETASNHVNRRNNPAVFSAWLIDMMGNWEPSGLQRDHMNHGL